MLNLMRMGERVEGPGGEVVLPGQRGPWAEDKTGRSLGHDNSEARVCPAAVRSPDNKVPGEESSSQRGASGGPREGEGGAAAIPEAVLLRPRTSGG